MLEHSIYSVISPEGAASILWRDGARAKDAAAAMKITGPDLIDLKIVDRLIPEPLGGAHADPDVAIQTVGDVVEEELKALMALSPDALRAQRAERFYAIGRFEPAISRHSARKASLSASGTAGNGPRFCAP